MTRFSKEHREQAKREGQPLVQVTIEMGHMKKGARSVEGVLCGDFDGIIDKLIALRLAQTEAEENAK